MKSYEFPNSPVTEEEGNQACVECLQTQADFLCGCKFPMIPVCVKCAETHFKKPRTHWKLPLIASLHIKSLERLKRTQNRDSGLKQGKRKAQELISSVELCEEEVSRICEQLVQEVLQRKAAVLSQLKAMKTDFLKDFNAAVQEVESNVYIEEYTPSPGIATDLWRYSAQNRLELPQFYATYTKPDISFSLQKFVSFKWKSTESLPGVIDSSNKIQNASQLTQEKRKDSILRGSSYGDIIFLQSAIRARLSRNDIAQELIQMVDFPDPEDTEIEPVFESHIDPMSLLSTAALTTLNQLLPFSYPFSVKNVGRYPAKVLPDGSIYIGQWGTRDDGVFRKGKGKLFSIQGWFSEGYWSGGRLHNLGRHISANGDWYSGGFDLGERSGQGSFEAFDTKNKYQGSWARNEMNGTGELLYANGGKYTGEFRSGAMSGTGEFLWSNGNSYQGTFLNGDMNGKGLYLWADGRSYNGEWKSGKLHGKGKSILASGVVYEGQFLDDKKEGYGVYRWDGKVYEGEWHEGKMHGIGELTVNGRKRKYEFQDGKRIREILE